MAGRRYQLRASDLFNPMMSARSLGLVFLDIATRLEALEVVPPEKPEVGPRVPTWTAPTLTNGFANLGGVFATAGYYKDAASLLVRVKGVVTIVAGAAVGLAAMTFPAGFRPTETHLFPVEGTGSTAQFLSLTAAGVLSPRVIVAAGGNFSMDFSFLAEQ